MFENKDNINTRMKSVVIIGAGVAGLEAAGRISKSGFPVTVIEKKAQTGGRLTQWHALFPARQPAAKLLDQLKARVLGPVHVMLNTCAHKIEKNDDGFVVLLEDGRLVTADAVMLTTGFDLFDAARKEEYGYGIYDNVITSVELEKAFQSGKKLRTTQGKVPTRIGFIHCVGSRDEKVGNPHCSKVCCVTAVKQAIEVKEMLPETEVFLFYMDLRMFGRHFEELYKEAQNLHGIQFIRARLSEAFENPDGSLQIRIEDTLLGKPMKMNLDLMVLMIGIQPDRKAGSITEITGLQKDTDGFMRQEDPYFNNHTSGMEGIFCAGGITGPKTIEETLVEARAASAGIIDYLHLKENSTKSMHVYDHGY